jgi:hypothetical protein
MISEQASLPRMIWGLHEQPPVAPKTPGARRAPLTEPQSTNYSASETPQDAAAANTPPSTVVATPESAKFGVVWQHPKLSFKSSAPYAKFKRSMQAVPRVGTLQSTNIGPDRFTYTDGHIKLGPSFSGKENAPLGSPFLLGDEQFETPGGYTEYRYINEDDSIPHWLEFVPISHHDPSEPATLASQHAAATQSLGSISLDATAYPTPNRFDSNSNIESENLNVPPNQAADGVKKNPALALSSPIPSEDVRPTNSIHNSTELTATTSIFAVRKAPRSQLHRPKLRDHPALAELLSNQSLHASSDRPTSLTIPPPLDIGDLALSLGVAPEALADSLQKLRTQKFTEPAANANNSPPFAIVAAHDSNARTPSNPAEVPALPPGIKIPEHLLTRSSGTSVAFPNELFSIRDEKPSHPFGVLRNPRSIPLARLRNKNQHRLARTSDLNESSTPLPIINDLEAGLPPGPIAKTPYIPESKHDTEMGGTVQDVARGRVVIGAGIQAQGPPMLSGFASKSKKHASVVDDVHNTSKEGSSTANITQSSLSKRGNRVSAPVPRPRAHKESSSARSNGTRGDSNSPIARHNRPKKAGSRLSRAKANSANSKLTNTSSDPAHHS